MIKKARFPSDVLKCEGKKAAMKTVPTFSRNNYETIFNSIVDLYE